MITTKEYLESLNEQKNALATHLDKTHLTPSKAEKFNTLIDKVKNIIETSRIEVEYDSDNKITKARLFNLKEITSHLFYNQPLTDVKFYNCSITSIGSYAFMNTKLTNFTIPDGVVKIGNNAFYNSSLSVLEIPSSVTEIGNEAYCGTKIKELNIPSNVKKIGSRAFYECSSLKSVTLPDTPIELLGAFGRTGLTTFDFPEWLTAIPDSMFYCCYSLKLSSLPNTITSIGSSAFQATGCSFTVIPDSVTTIGSRAFIGMPSTSMRIPNSVTSLGTSLFAGTASVSTLYLNCNCDIPNGVITDTINKNAKLKYIEIGAIGIKLLAFQGCTNLLKVWIRETCTTIEASTYSYPFTENKNVVLYVEADDKPEGWSEYFNKTSSSTYANVVYGVKESPF